MLIIGDAIRGTEARFAARAAARAANLARLRIGQVLSVDDPRRVALRLGRLRQSAGDPAAVRTGLERILGESDLMPVSYFERGTQVARSVGRVQIRTRSGQTVGYGTGALVAPRLLITNNHVLSDAGEAATSRVEFDYEEGPDGARRPTTVVGFDPAAFFLTDRALDFTIVAIAGDGAEVTGRRWNPLLKSQGKVIVGEYVSIIQHPNGESKQLALRENQLVDILPDHLHYRTDTAPGSSGSLVFNDEWEAVALHHMGVPRRDAQGNPLTRDGSPWQDGMDDSLIDWIANEGVRVSRIVAALKAASLGARQRELLEPAFEPVGFAAATENAGGGSLGCGAAAPQAGGAMRWTVPLEITVRVPAAPAARALPVRARGAVPRAEAPPEPAPPPKRPRDDPELRAALAEAKKAGARTYYGAAADAKARTGYYAKLKLGSDGGSNFRKLHALLEATHTTLPPYSPARQVYPWVDLHPDRRIRSIYSGKAFSAEELIRLDFEIAARRAELAASLRGDRAPGTEVDREFDLLEASLPYNCEHVVPQSWFGKREPMRGDIHHLFACESGCNSFRGNTPYYEFPVDEEALRTACGRREENKFEPSTGKATVARAALYFLLRYPGEINAVAKEYTPDRLAILLAWHAASPPDQYEKHRNAAIFAVQGNRNPLIDHPEWAARIRFEEGLG